MRPEDIFKIEKSSQISEESIPDTTSSENSNSSEEMLIPKKKELTLEDLMDYLKKNNIDANESIIEKTYTEIITNKKEKESITNVIKTLENEKNIIREQIENGDPDGIGILNNKLAELNDKLANLNVNEREKEDNIKNYINNIFENKVENKNINKNEYYQTNNNEITNVKNDLLKMVNEGLDDVNPEIKKLENNNTPNTLNQLTENINNSNTNDNTSENTDISNFLNDQKDNSLTNNLINNTLENTNISNFLNDQKNKTITNSSIENNNISNVENSSIENNKTETEILNTVNDLQKTNDNNLETLQAVDNQMPQFKGDDKHETLLAATQKTHDLISKLTDQISGGFDSMHSKMGTIERSTYQTLENYQNQTGVIQNGNNHIHSNIKREKNYINEYRESLRTNLPLNSLMGIQTELKGNNIGSYL
jgi:hypothetical protein